MTIGLVGRKVGMTRIFTDEGGTLPVTVLDVSDNRITQIKTAEKDGYAAVQVAFGKRRASRVNKAIAGQLAKAAVEAGHMLKEFRAKPDELANLKVGGKIGVEIFKVGQKVDVQGVTIGKGFAGVIKRHHFSSNRASHGNSISHNKPGSTGQNQSPSRVFPGKRMAGHLGDVQRTILNLEVVRVDAERQLLLVKGSVPGSSGRDVVVRPAIKLAKPKGPSGKPAPKAAEPKAAKSEAKPAAKPDAKPAAKPDAKPAAKPAEAKPAPAKS
jgi:large subunit ribosomal protein L3